MWFLLANASKLILGFRLRQDYKIWNFKNSSSGLIFDTKTSGFQFRPDRSVSEMVCSNMHVEALCLRITVGLDKTLAALASQHLGSQRAPVPVLFARPGSRALGRGMTTPDLFTTAP